VTHVLKDTNNLSPTALSALLAIMVIKVTPMAQPNVVLAIQELTRIRLDLLDVLYAIKELSSKIPILRVVSLVDLVNFRGKVNQAVTSVVKVRYHNYPKTNIHRSLW
jgi:hypothetical protein